MNAKLEPLFRLFTLIRSVDAFGREHASLLDVYEDTIYLAIAQLLSAFGGLCINSNLAEDQQEHTPYHDFGPEPETREEAVIRLPEFLDQVGQFLHEGSDVREVPVTMMHVRAGTFAFLLADGEVKL
jgi:hypothetical protein